MILVTGGTGFVGGHVVHALRQAGKPVRCLVRDRRKAATLTTLGCELAEGDMTDAASLQRAVDGIDTVLHLVAIRQGKKEQFQRIMVDGTRNFLRHAKESGVKRFVHMSALGTTSETKDLVPYYGAKWEQEQDVQRAGIPYVIFRPSFAFGRDGGILPTFRRLAKLAPVTPIIGSGQQRIQPIWVDDIAAYFEKAVDLEAATNRTFELGGPDVVAWNEFWERLKRALGVRRPSVHVPVGLMKMNAFVTERLPGNIPLTRDLLKMLELGDNVASNDEAVHDLSASPRHARRAAAPGCLMPEPQIVAMGGLGEDQEAGTLIRFVLGLTGKERPRVCLIPTAGAEKAEYIVRFYAELNRFADCSHVTFFPWPPENLRELVLSQDVLFVSGGSTANMLAVWRAHGFDQIVREAWEQGIVLAGSSAGMICWFEAGVTDSFGPQLEGMRDGLGFLPGSACPHYDGEELRRPVYQELVANGFPPGIAADDAVGLHYVGTELREVVTYARRFARLPRRTGRRDTPRRDSPRKRVGATQREGGPQSGYQRWISRGASGRLASKSAARNANPLRWLDDSP